MATFNPANILDNFDRANSGPPLGGNWTVIYGMDAGFKVVSNQMVPSSSSQTEGEYRNNTTYGADSYAYITADTVDHSSDYSATRLFLRLVSPTTSGIDGYVAYFIWRNAGATLDDAGAYRIDNNVETLLGAEILSSGWANGDVYEIGMAGSTFTMYRNASSLGARTDSTYSAAGYIGVSWYYNDASIAKYNDFGGGTISAAATTYHNLTLLGVGG